MRFELENQRRKEDWMEQFGFGGSGFGVGTWNLEHLSKKNQSPKRDSTSDTAVCQDDTRSRYHMMLLNHLFFCAVNNIQLCY